MLAKSIAISGDLGSGKTSVSIALAERLGVPRVGAGDLHRAIAADLGFSTLELNRYAEKHAAVDEKVDQMLKDIAKSGEARVVDSRLAWFFIPDSVKVHLVVDPNVGAQRIVGTRSGPVERYSSFAEAKTDLTERRQRERTRFQGLYGIDVSRLRNYDLVMDTTQAPIRETADLILDVLSGQPGERADDDAGREPARPLIFLAPKTVYPTKPIGDLREFRDRNLAEEVRAGGPAVIEPIRVGYSRSCFFALDGHRRLKAAIQADVHYLRAVLTGEGPEQVADGRTADQYFQLAVRPALVYDWAAAHGISLELPRRDETVGADPAAGAGRPAGA